MLQLNIYFNSSLGTTDLEHKLSEKKLFEIMSIMCIISQISTPQLKLKNFSTT